LVIKYAPEAGAGALGEEADGGTLMENEVDGKAAFLATLPID
jgi:hypothetical protein